MRNANGTARRRRATVRALAMVAFEHELRRKILQPRRFRLTAWTR
jgi:hypothetical protein